MQLIRIRQFQFEDTHRSKSLASNKKCPQLQIVAVMIYWKNEQILQVRKTSS
jgi:hypothetical protein